MAKMTFDFSVWSVVSVTVEGETYDDAERKAYAQMNKEVIPKFIKDTGHDVLDYEVTSTYPDDWEGDVRCYEEEFNGIKFPAWHITYKNKRYYFSTYELAYQLIDANGNPVNEEAKMLDDTYCYYLDDEEMRHEITYDYLLQLADVED